MFERFRMPGIDGSFPALAPQAPLPFSAAWHLEQLGQVEMPPSTVDLVALLRCVRREIAALRVARVEGARASPDMAQANEAGSPARAQTAQSTSVAPKRARDAKLIPVATEPGDLVDAKWVAQRCRVSPSTAHKWMREICGRTVGTGQVLRVTLGEFQSFWERRQRKGCRHGKNQ